MKWTTAKPKKPGYYWCLPAGANTPTPARVTEKFIIVGSAHAYMPTDPIFDGCQFAGPMTWPEIPKGKKK